MALCTHGHVRVRVGPVTLLIGAGAATHFNSDDLEAGSARKGLPDGVGPPGAGIWRLELSSLLDIEVLSYARTSDGFVTSLHDTAPAARECIAWCSSIPAGTSIR